MANTEPSLHVSPSEAFLLGACLGEYNRHCEPESTFWFRRKRFIDILRERVELFIPSFRHLSTRKIAQSDLPEDLEWWEPGCTVGTSPSHPESLYRRRDGDYEATR